MTPYGLIPADLVRRFGQIAGYRWDKEAEAWVVCQDEVDHWQLNRADDRRSNEGLWYRKKGWLAIRCYNFEYALYKCDHDPIRALDYASKNLFENDGKPVYLPDRLALRAGLGTSQRHLSYSKILNAETEKERNKNRQN